VPKVIEPSVHKHVRYSEFLSVLLVTPKNISIDESQS